MHRRTFPPDRRFVLIAAAVTCFVTAGVLTPSSVRSQFDASAPGDSIALPARVDPPPAAVTPANDAFEPRAPLDEEPRPYAPRPSLPMLPAPPPVRAAARAQRVVPQVTAVATGAHPTAIVELGGVSRLVTVGDALDGASVTAIQDEAVLLSDGRALGIAR